MRRTRTLIGLLVFFVVLFVVPSPVKQFAHNVFFFAAKPVFALIQGSHQAVSGVLSVPRWMLEHEKIKKQNSAYARLGYELEELRNENKRLRSLIEFRDSNRGVVRQMVMAEVIGRSPTGWRESLVINKGSAAGIAEDMPVVTAEGLLGKVVEVIRSVSKVQLVTDPEFRVGALIQRTRHTGVVYGTVEGEMRMKYIDLDADIVRGDAVITAGLASEFPKGLLIGTVMDVWKETGQVYKVASIKPAADLNRLEEVICVRR